VSALRKSFSSRRGAIVVPTRPPAALARENGLKRRPRAWPPPRDFTFVVKMYAPNVAQGWEQYSLKNDARRLDTGGELM
jgi:hypothetical protein